MLPQYRSHSLVYFSQPMTLPQPNSLSNPKDCKLGALKIMLHIIITTGPSGPFNTICIPKVDQTELEHAHLNEKYALMLHITKDIDHWYDHNL